MQRKELRIGNLVLASDVNSGMLVNYTISDGSCIDNAKWFWPIPLTEGWLLKFGFVKDDARNYRSGYKIKHDNDIYYFWLRDNLPKENGSCGILGYFTPEEKGIPAPTNENLDNTIDQEEVIQNFAWNIKFVHELQNLWQSITGEELTIKQ